MEELDELINFRISKKRYRNSLKRKKNKKTKKRIDHERYLSIKKQFGGEITYEKLLENWLPSTISFLLECDKTNFSSAPLISSHDGTVKMPKVFSVVDNPKESFEFIKSVTLSILSLKYEKIVIDYSDCKRIELGAQIFLDIILKDILKFFSICRGNPIKSPKFPKIGGDHIKNPLINKMLFSVGSPAIHNNHSIKFDDVIPYKLCIHNKHSNRDKLKRAERKEIDSTKMVEYVIASLERLGKELTPEKIEDLSTVIGEILINAEEHSTNSHRYSIGYFQELELKGKKFGLFNLVILNFGDTIYQKFKSEDCPNKDIVKRMEELSSKYTERKLFSDNFTEESLWTLYALQEGVTSVSTEKYKRGNGSIRFIESFFNIKGIKDEKDQISRLTLLSGNSNITFDGSYDIVNKDEFKVMTFNKSGNLEDKPDKKYVKKVKDYFPGTLISARILINEDDIL